MCLILPKSWHILSKGFPRYFGYIWAVVFIIINQCFVNQFTENRSRSIATVEVPGKNISNRWKDCNYCCCYSFASESLQPDRTLFAQMLSVTSSLNSFKHMLIIPLMKGWILYQQHGINYYSSPRFQFYKRNLG